MSFLTFLGFLYFFAGSTSQSEERSLGDQLDDGAVSAEVRDFIGHVTNILLISFAKYSVIIYIFYHLDIFIGMCVPLILIYALHVNVTG